MDDDDTITGTTGTRHEVAAPGPGGATRPEGWVAADERSFGVDRRTIAPALIILAVVLLAQVVMPGLDAAVPLEDVTDPGEVLAVGDVSLGDEVVTFVPPTGWEIVRAATLDDMPAGPAPATATLTDGASTLSVTVGAFAGDATDLLDTVLTTSAAVDPSGPQAVGEPTSAVTAAGTPGLLTAYGSLDRDGAIGVLVSEGTGVDVVLVGPRRGTTSPDGDPQEIVATVFDSLARTTP